MTNNTPLTEDEPLENEEEKSRSAVKREAQALLDVGRALTKLNAEQLTKIPLDEKLLITIEEFKRIKSFNAQKRHLHFLAKLIRKSEHENIVIALEKLQEKQHLITRQQHLFEQWRDDLIEGNNQNLQEFIQLFPQTDRQQLGQLVRNAKKEKEQKKSPSSARKLFKFIREQFIEQEIN